MRSRTFRLILAIVIGPLALAGIVCGIVVNDQTVLLSAILLMILYIVYLIKVIPLLKKEKTRETKAVSPLQRRF